MTTLICDCNRTMPLDSAALGTVLDEGLTLHSSLCRREAGAFLKAVGSGHDLVVACTQEQRLFAELAQQSPSPTEAPIRFVNIRETAGWSKQARASTPKIAALIAAAQLPDPAPVPTVTFRSQGRLLIIGPQDLGEALAASLSDALSVTLFATQPGDQGGAQERRFPVLAGTIGRLSGWLGAFEFEYTRVNPIDLDLCTRCNACLAACPEGAIGLDYQIDLNACRSHRACVKACSAVSAIDFNREPETFKESFDLVLDLRAAPAFTQHALPQGYVHWPEQSTRDPLHLARLLAELRDRVGEFEKPRFFEYTQRLCAHTRNEKTGCSACIEVCSASAISSERERKQIKVNPHLCVGCGACTTVCPSGALGYAYPRTPDTGARLKTLLSTYTQAGGRDAAILFHGQEQGRRLIEDLGRAVSMGGEFAGVPARVIPVPLWHTASVGLELWLSAIAYGASQVWVLITHEEAPQYLEALRAQTAVAQAILSGLGFAGEHLRIIECRDARELPHLDASLRAQPAQGVSTPARFGVQSDKRGTLELALDHLIRQAPQTPEFIALPAASPLGSLRINTEACTLCMSCVSACPASALQDNPDTPQLRLIEKNCVQCGLCVRTCPERAIALEPRLRISAKRREPVVLSETPPYRCIRCSKPFGTVKAIEAMLGRLAGHAMFQGEALQRLKMCADCRVIDIYTNPNETRIDDV